MKISLKRWERNQMFTVAGENPREGPFWVRKAVVGKNKMRNKEILKIVLKEEVGKYIKSKIFKKLNLLSI